ncbi:YqjK-like family protein [Rugosibacter aromaticivorans]|uniref:YqjK family protein n=1 Tax=Rugosibacter aromaticivorans TaxID=1565605 RepID=UPI0012198CB9|nr:MAG: hypothetical protein EPO43_00380 [Rugosibacter sp.]
MNSKTLELVLRKQRVQFASEHLRRNFVNHLGSLSPALDTADRLCAGALWLRRHPHVLIGIGMALIVARPRRVIGWVRRALIGWQMWRKLRDTVTHKITPKTYNNLRSNSAAHRGW